MGDAETAVREVEGLAGFVRRTRKGEDRGGSAADRGAICFPRVKPREEEDEEGGEEGDARIEYFRGLSPGRCHAQLENILGLAVGRMMQAREWRTLPKSLKNYGDCR